MIENPVVELDTDGRRRRRFVWMVAVDGLPGTAQMKAATFSFYHAFGH